MLGENGMPKLLLKRNIRLCLLVSQLAIGGSERQVFLFVKAMQLRGFDISILSLNYRGKDYWEEQISELGIPIIKIPRGNIISRTFKIAKVLHDLEIDIVQSWAFYANPYVNIAGLIAGISLRFGVIREHPSYWQASGFIRVFELYGLDGILCNSRIGMEETKKRYHYLPPLYFIPNIVDVPNCIYRNKLRDLLGQKFSIDVNAPWIVGVGRLDKNKNWEFLIRSLKRITREYHLVIIGKGPEMPALKTVVNELGLWKKVHFVGEIPDASKILMAFDIFCFSSNSEGMPNALMEASAAGLPIVSTNVGGVKDIVLDGYNGYLIELGDENLYIEKLINLLDSQSLRIFMGSNGRQMMKDRFGSNQVAYLASQIYRGG